MSRLLILITIGLWLVWDSGAYSPSRIDPLTGALIFLGALLGGCAALLGWGLSLARTVGSPNHHRLIRRLNLCLTASRTLLPIWFGVGLFVLEWGRTVQVILGPVGRWPLELPAFVIGYMPVLLAWLAMLCAQYPAESATREYDLLDQLESDLPISAPPSLRGFLDAHIRMQLLFTLAPIMLIWLVRDLGSLVAWVGFGVNVNLAGTELASGAESSVEWVVIPISILIVVLFAPELLRRVLKTTPLPPSPLRERLDAMCLRLNLRCRQILIWQTDNTICNAIVMGLFPRVRYVLLSDLLIESMTDEQIEAVFAHEAGHIKHRHIAWYATLILLMAATLAGPGEALARALIPYLSVNAVDLIVSAICIGAFLLMFAGLSRLFERQADVFAARTLAPVTGNDGSFVRRGGMEIFNSALYCVARINGMPTDLHSRFRGGIIDRLTHMLVWLRFTAANWTHGSIGQRMRFLHSLSDVPQRTYDFDRRMRWVYWLLVVALTSLCIWAVILQNHPVTIPA